MLSWIKTSSFLGNQSQGDREFAIMTFFRFLLKPYVYQSLQDNEVDLQNFSLAKSESFSLAVAAKINILFVSTIRSYAF